MLGLISGGFGEGKTLRLLLNGLQHEGELWANFHLNLEDYRYIVLSDLESIPRGTMVLFDEFHLYFSSRRTQTLDNEFVTRVIYQVGKIDSILWGTIHRFMDIDPRFRASCHLSTMCKRIGKKPKGWNRLNDHRDFRFTTMDMDTGETAERVRMNYSNAKKYFELFNTREIIKKYNHDSLNLDLLHRYDPEKFYSTMESYAEEVKENIEGKITYAKIRNYIGKKYKVYVSDNVTRSIFAELS